MIQVRHKAIVLAVFFMLSIAGIAHANSKICGKLPIKAQIIHLLNAYFAVDTNRDYELKSLEENIEEDIDRKGAPQFEKVGRLQWNGPCYQRPLIEQTTKEATLALVYKKTNEEAYALTGDTATAHNIALLFKQEAYNLLTGAVEYGCLKNFRGNNLKRKVSLYYNGMQKKNLRTMVEQHLNHYFTPFDNMTRNNVNAIANDVIDALQNHPNLNADTIRNAVLDTAQNFIANTAHNKAERLYTTFRAEQIKNKIDSQLTNRVNNNHLRTKGLTTETQGMLKDYLGEKLEKEIKAIYRDLNR